MAFSPDGRILATASADRSVILWDLTDPDRPRRLGQPLTGHSDYVYFVAFSPDGRTLATASTDFSVILWDLTDLAHPQRLGKPLNTTNAVVSVAFTPDSNTLATASTDGTVMLWDLTGLNHLRDHAAERACAITGRGLDRDQWARYVPELPYQNTCPT